MPRRHPYYYNTNNLSPNLCHEGVLRKFVADESVLEVFGLIDCCWGYGRPLWRLDKVNLDERQGHFEDKMGKVSSHFGAGPCPGCPKPVKFEANLGRE